MTKTKEILSEFRFSGVAGEAVGRKQLEPVRSQGQRRVSQAWIWPSTVTWVAVTIRTGTV